jgi:chemotaxis protein MotA
LLDLSTIFGLIAGVCLLAIGILITPGADMMLFVSPASAFITIGGSICAVFVTFPIGDLKSVGKVLKMAFKYEKATPNVLIKDFRRYADIARRDGILALENVTQEVRDPFMIRGIQLAVDGTDPEVIQSMMLTELDYIHDRHLRGIKIMKQLAVYAPAFGMIGTLIGLVIMLANLEDPSMIGPSMAVAMITTLYGAVVTNLFATPIAEKLGVRNNEERLIKELIIKGVMSIQSGDNPRIVEQKLKIFIPPRFRED